MSIDTSKIIHGVVGGGRYTVTSPIVKEDYGLYLKIEGLELPSTYEVDFSNSEHNGTSVTMIGNSDGVLIPSQFISSGKDVFAFLYHVGANYGRTVYKFRIPNKLRPDRTDEEPTPEEQSTIDQAISALNSAVAQTAQDVIDADASAQSASESAEQAQESARTAGLYSDTAQTYANSAEISANSASASAEASAQSASQSAQIKADVEDMVDDAQGYAQASAQSASASANSASQASASATSAIQASSNASDMALSAQTYSEIAQNHATHAGQSAQTASTKATESAQSATSAQGYAQTAESAKTASQTAQGLAESARDLAQGYAEDAQGYANDAQASAESISASASQIAKNSADILKAFPTDTASGAIASFTDGADDIPLKSLVVNIDPVQDTSSGDPSPENICPISGWTEINAYNDPLHGGNIEWNQVCDNDFLNHYQKSGSASIAKSGNSYTITYGTSNSLFYLASDYRKLYATSGQKIFVMVKNYNTANIGTSTVRFSFETSLTAGNTIDETLPVSGAAIYTARSNVYGFGMYAIQNQDGNKISFDAISVFNLTQMFGAGNEPPTVEEFRALFPNDYYSYNEGEKTTVSAVNNKPYTHVNIQLGQTVYGGKLDVLSGEMTVYPYYASYNGETLTGEWISDRDKYVSGTAPTIGAQVVNIGAQGVTVQLEPHEVNSLLGVNNIWSDTGDTSCEYRADTKLYIEKLTEPDADMIADANITSGKYFMVGNNLYLATANIASGAQVIVGTNAIRKSLSEALNEINS